MRDINAFLRKKPDGLWIHRTGHHPRAAEPEAFPSQPAGDRIRHPAETPVGLVHEEHVEALAGQVPQIFARGEVQRLLADVCGLVRDTFKTPRHGDQRRAGVQPPAGLLAPIPPILVYPLPDLFYSLLPCPWPAG